MKTKGREGPGKAGQPRRDPGRGLGAEKPSGGFGKAATPQRSWVRLGEAGVARCLWKATAGIDKRFYSFFFFSSPPNRRNG